MPGRFSSCYETGNVIGTNVSHYSTASDISLEKQNETFSSRIDSRREFFLLNLVFFFSPDALVSLLPFRVHFYSTALVPSNVRFRSLYLHESFLTPRGEPEFIYFRLTTDVSRAPFPAIVITNRRNAINNSTHFYTIENTSRDEIQSFLFENGT